MAYDPNSKDNVLPNGVSKPWQAEGDLRVKVYSDWHRTLDRRYYMSDVDSIEWRYVDGVLRPVALIELTRVDSDTTVPQSYFDIILERYNNRSMHGGMARFVADKLGVCAFIVVFGHTLDDFWLYNLTKDKGWHHLTKGGYINFLDLLEKYPRSMEDAK